MSFLCEINYHTKANKQIDSERWHENLHFLIFISNSSWIREVKTRSVSETISEEKRIAREIGQSIVEWIDIRVIRSICKFSISANNKAPARYGAHLYSSTNKFIKSQHYSYLDSFRFNQTMNNLVIPKFQTTISVVKRNKNILFNLYQNM